MRRDLRYALTAGLFTALTPLSHLGTAPFLAASLVLFFLAYGHHKQGLIGAVIIGVVAIAVTAPWWATVAARHGFGPFLAAGRTGGSSAPVAASRNSAWPARDSAPWARASRCPCSRARSARRARRSATTVLLPMVDGDARARRSSGETYAAIPVALLVGIAVNDVFSHCSSVDAARVPAVSALSTADSRRRRSRMASHTTLRGRGVREEEPARHRGDRLSHPVARGVGADARRQSRRRRRVRRRRGLAARKQSPRCLASLSPDQREAMHWVATHTPPTSRFFVVPERGWPADREGEWFPVLAEPPSVATVGNRVTDAGFTRYKRLFNTARDCASRTRAV